MSKSPADLRPATWWRDAVIYQIYPKSFADANGDGYGDLNGVRQHLDYLRDLGVDAIWFCPIFTSPQTDGGYDVADYYTVDPMFGTNEDLDLLITEAHNRGIKVILDIVPNHSSDQHRFFQEALATRPPSAAWDRYHVLRGRGEAGQLAPNEWMSWFGGRAWTQIHFEGEPTGYWYLHIFDRTQPDLNWNNPDVVAEIEGALRFWFDRGVDGFRVDVAHGLVKHPDYVDGVEEDVFDSAGVWIDRIPLPFMDQPGVHDIYPRWREISDSYDPPRIYVGEVATPTAARNAAYTRPDELHTGFNLGYLSAQWHLEAIRKNIDENLRLFGAIGAPATWVTDNHDCVRSVTRWGCEWPAHNDHNREPIDSRFSNHYQPTEADIARGRERARAALLLMLALPGNAYIYQGQELALDEAEVPNHLRQDPAFINSDGRVLGRDGVRVPMPWTRHGKTLGFGPEDGAAPWLPSVDRYAPLSVESQDGDRNSMLNLTRTALRMRRELAAFGEGTLAWRDDVLSNPDVLFFDRKGVVGETVSCVTNFSAVPVSFVARTLLLGSQLDVHMMHDVVILPPDTTAWVILK